MHRARPATRVVDVHGVDADQPRATLAQIECNGLGQIRVTLEVALGVPVGVPASMHQHGPAAQLLAMKSLGIHRRRYAIIGAHDDPRQVREAIELDLRRVLALGKAMKRASTYVPVLLTISILPIWNSV